MNDQLPTDHALEQQILGAAIASRANAETYALDHKITEHAFTTDHHTTIWRLVQHRIDHAKGALDPHVLHATLQATPDLIEGHYSPDEIMGTVAQVVRASTGTTNPEHADRLLDLEERRRIIRTCQATIRLAGQPDQRPADILVDHDQQITAAQGPEGRTTQTIGQIIERTIPSWEHPEQAPRLQTGFHDLDRTLKGLKPGNLCIIGARPAMGKTALAIDFTANAGTQGDVLFASLEMTDEEIAARYTAGRTATPGHWLTHGEGRHNDHRDDDTWARIMALADQDVVDRIHVIVRRGLQVRDCVRIAKRTHTRRPLKLVVVDYLQLLKPTDLKAPRHLQVAEMANELKTLAFDLECPVIALSQLNRECETRNDKRPMMSDLRESGDVEQTADQVLLLYRDDYYDDNSKTPGIVEVNVAKNRHGGTGVVPLTFEGRYPRFLSSAKPHQLAQAPPPPARSVGPNHDLPLPNAS